MAASTKTLYIRNVSGSLLRRAKARAALEGRTLGDLVIGALRATLDGSDPEPDDAFARAVAWYEANLESLRADYAGRYVAIVDGEVLDHDPDFGPLAERVFGRLGSTSVFMPRVDEPPRTVRVRGPRRR